METRALKQLRFPGFERRGDVSKFTLRHGVHIKSDHIAHDIQARVKFLTFPLLDVAEPTIHHIGQVKVHRDFRHIGLHSNTTWLNERDEVVRFSPDCFLTFNLPGSTNFKEKHEFVFAF